MPSRPALTLPTQTTRRGITWTSGPPTLPTLDGITLRLDSLFSTLDGWSLRLRATPRWFRYRDNGNRKWSPVEISAQDDRGRPFSGSFAGSSGRDGHQYLTLRFHPRLPAAAGASSCAHKTLFFRQEKSYQDLFPKAPP
jgi:hypothetical protein